MKIGITYDLKEDYLREGYSEEDAAEFDRAETIQAIDSSLRSLGHATDRIGHVRSLAGRLVKGERWDLVFNIAEGLNGFGSSDKNFEVWHPTYGKPGKRGLLQSYCYEDYARWLDQLDEAKRKEQLIADMDEVHPGLRPHLETVVTKSWAHDPYERGAFVVYHPHQQQWYSEICRCEGKIWFAGEHASPWPGWMQGAIASGTKAAREVSAELG